MNSSENNTMTNTNATRRQPTAEYCRVCETLTQSQGLNANKVCEACQEEDDDDDSSPRMKIEDARPKLTQAEARTIRRVLASGGDVLLTQGRLTGPGRKWAVQKVTTRKLIERGLLEGNPGQWFAGTYSASERAGRDDQHLHFVFATAAGCAALNAHEAKKG